MNPQPQRPKIQLFRGIVLLIPTILLLFVLFQLFPYTGIMVIIVFPIIILMNAALIYAILKKAGKDHVRITKRRYALSLLVTTCGVVALFPQSSGTHIVVQAIDGFNAIRHLDGVTVDDLKLKKDKSGYVIGDSSERYVAALYKFRQEIPMDGSFHIYERDGNPKFDPVITEVGQIPEKLSGFHKVMWWVLGL
ncbi:hypothetical protein [Paenibacillus xylanexedens]|uniref:hypothetical protein n=1 Tax=Paenibacillus xylanexedens TaxID=528191 RepID=UPI000F538DEF|nr:hypothetical protein [Paenibacillus xylanexedens]RPK29621.1 hypothetical protein EDO6_00244 [Paenibacillus xylanexedens]